MIHESTEKKKEVKENLPQEEIQHIEANVNSIRIQADASFYIKQENAELERNNTKLPQ